MLDVFLVVDNLLHDKGLNFDKKISMDYEDPRIKTRGKMESGRGK